MCRGQLQKSRCLLQQRPAALSSSIRAQDHGDVLLCHSPSTRYIGSTDIKYEGPHRAKGAGAQLHL